MGFIRFGSTRIFCTGSYGLHSWSATQLQRPIKVRHPKQSPFHPRTFAYQHIINRSINTAFPTPFPFHMIHVAPSAPPTWKLEDHWLNGSVCKVLLQTMGIKGRRPGSSFGSFDVVSRSSLADLVLLWLVGLQVTRCYKAILVGVRICAATESPLLKSFSKSSSAVGSLFHSCFRLSWP